MHRNGLFSIGKRLGGCVALSVLALLSASAMGQATNGSLTGTYTLIFGSPGELYIQTNMFGQEVGFCPNSGQLPFGYSCQNQALDQDVLSGTLVADGNGNIISGSSYTYIADPNRYQCSSKYNPTPDCPYQVPSGNTWSNSTSYVVGDVVDYTVNGKTLTYQVVKKNTNVPPSGTAVCTSKTGKNPPACYWDQLHQSANGTSGNSGSLSGSYAIQSDGSGTLQLTPSNSNGPVTFAMVVPATSAVGQEVPLVGLPQLNQEFRGSGAAVRIK
jgi:hypothetical protein